ncbi:MAG: DNA polymerase [Desulfobacteraceae bacterium 4572_35.1]|nr:MAG: DNA polymerase [Desulfobacteraceae bacterium 4572_35.1]
MSEDREQTKYVLLAQARSILTDLDNWGIDELCVPIIEGSAAETLDDIQTDLGNCQRCGLASTRKNIVFGAGHPRARVVFVGEGPGRDEDQQGYPFVGEAGKLLDRILAAMGLCRDEVYICNVIKCRPPQNRNPNGDEISACEPFLRRQLAVIKPQIIVAMGRFAAQTLLQQQVAISKLRGTWYSYQDIPLMPTFHPAYLLRNPAGKREVWEDMKQVLRRLQQEDV